MTEDFFLLFDDFAARHARGERPDVRDYLARAGDSKDDLAELIDGFLVATPAPEPDEETVALMSARVAHQPPLVELRARRGIRVDDVVEALVSRLGLDRRKRPKVKRYYQRLEGGLLDPRGVGDRVWRVLADVLRGPVGELGRWTSPAGVSTAYLRMHEAMDVEASPAPRAEAADEELDEIDRLFLRRGA